MIEKEILRNLILEVLKKSPHTQFVNIIGDVEHLIKERDLFPNEGECQRLKVDYRYYQQKELNPADKFTIVEVTWDLITERIVTPGYNHDNINLPFVSLTPFGQQVMTQAAPHYYDPGSNSNDFELTFSLNM